MAQPQHLAEAKLNIKEFQSYRHTFPLDMLKTPTIKQIKFLQEL